MNEIKLKLPISDQDLSLIHLALGFAIGVISERKDENFYSLQRQLAEVHLRLCKAQEEMKP